MNCKISEENLAHYAEQLLTKEEMKQIASHINMCERCNKITEQYYQLSNLLLFACESEKTLHAKAEALLERCPGLESNTDSIENTDLADQRFRGLFSRNSPKSVPEHTDGDATSRKCFALLDAYNAVYSGHVQLPGGYHTGSTFILQNIEHFEALTILAKMFRRKFADVDYDLIIAHGPTMEDIGLELSRMVGLGGMGTGVISSRGYPREEELYSLRIHYGQDQLQGKKVVILQDVMVRGRLTEKIVDEIRDAGGQVVKIGIVVNGGRYQGKLIPLIVSLCTHELQVYDPADTDHPCPLCVNEIPLERINPFTLSVSIPKKKEIDHKINDRISDFLNMAGDLGALRKHHVEDGVHYGGFIDTLKLFGESGISRMIATDIKIELEQQIWYVPMATHLQVIAIPSQPRARRMANIFKKVCIPDAQIIEIEKTGQTYMLLESHHRAFTGRNVFVLDVAASSGETLKDIFILVQRCNPSKIAMVVFLNRMIDIRTKRLSNLVEGRFFSAYELFPDTVYKFTGGIGKFCYPCWNKHRFERMLGYENLDPSLITYIYSKLHPKFPSKPELRKNLSPEKVPPQATLFPSLASDAFNQGYAAIIADRTSKALTNGMAPLDFTLLDKAYRKDVFEWLGGVAFHPADLARTMDRMNSGESVSRMARDRSMTVSKWLTCGGVLAANNHWEWLPKIDNALQSATRSFFRDGCERSIALMLVSAHAERPDLTSTIRRILERHRDKWKGDAHQQWKSDVAESILNYLEPVCK